MHAADAPDLTPDILLGAYAAGMFPMAESADDPDLFWVEPRERGIFPLDGLVISRSLAKTIRSDRFEVRVDHDFESVIAACAAPAKDRENTWINTTIRRLYKDLFVRGHCHTVECWHGGRLVGGLYGVHLGGAFFGESMFHTMTDASKVALAHLVARLNAGGFRLLDTQFVTPHLASLGAVAMARDSYRRMLDRALAVTGDFHIWSKDAPVSGARILAELAKVSCSGSSDRSPA